MPTVNHPVRDFRSGSAEAKSIQTAIAAIRSDGPTFRPVIGGKHLDGGDPVSIIEPHARSSRLGEYRPASAGDGIAAADAAMEARNQWARLTLDERAFYFARAADLLEGAFGDRLLAATMLGQSKTVYQAEIDAICELIDFLRFNIDFAQQISEWQPVSDAYESNRMDYRPLDGFVLAAAPFNFTAIAGNLVIAPALMGNPVVWMPSNRSVYSSALLMELFEEAGIPPGVINFCPTDDPAVFASVVLNHADLAGIHFTGSSATFDHIWQTVGRNVSTYKAYPRLVGETGGKDFVLAHPSADIEILVTALLRGAFDYQGQKCSAASRAYIPRSIYTEVCDRLVAEANGLTLGDVADPANFMGAVIDERAYRSISRYLNVAAGGPDTTVLTDRQPDESEGWFIPPTVIECSDPKAPIMTEEIFGPVLSLFCYDDDSIEYTCHLIEESTRYALTGAIVGEDEVAVEALCDRLRWSVGNLYLNDKPSGAVVGRQPFGGSRRSGTNDKAGSPLNLFRWISPRTVKRNLQPPRQHTYPHMSSES